MDERLLCYVNCTQPASPWGSLRAVVEAQLGTKLTTPADPAETGPLLHMQGGTVVVLDVRAPCPVRELSDDLSQQNAWPGWKNARSHFVVAPFDKLTSSAELRDAAEAVLQVAAAIAHATQADAVGWGPTNLFWPARTFVDGVAKTPLSVELLVRCLWSGRQDASGGGMEVTTTGLRTFGLPEFDYGPSALRPEAIYHQVMNLSAYLMANGLVLQHGQTFGSSETPEATIEHARDDAGSLVLVVRQAPATSARNPVPFAAQPPAGMRRPVFGRKNVSPVPGDPLAGLPAPEHLRLVGIDGLDAPGAGKPDRPAFSASF